MIIGIVAGALIIFSLIFGFGGNADFFNEYAEQAAKAVKKEVQNKETKESALQSIETARVGVEASVSRAVKSQIRMREVDLAYDSTLQDYMGVEERLDKELTTQLALVAKSHFQMKELLTEQEWKAVSERFSDKMGKQAKKQVEQLEKEQAKRVKRWQERLEK